MSRTPRRRLVASLLVAGLLIGTVGLFGQELLRDLVTRALGEPGAAARPLSPEEADRLAQMRQQNYQDARAGVRAAIGPRDNQLHAVGWVDWQRPMAYLALSGEQPGEITELVQAVPGLVATRAGPDGQPAPAETPAPDEVPEPEDGAETPEPPEIIDPHPPPPVDPPTDGWQLRRPGDDPVIDTLVVLLFTITADHPDAADLLARSESQWLRRDRTAGYDVDVLLGPAVPPSPAPAPTPAATPDPSLAAMGGAVQYWLDDQGRLHRLEALLAANMPARVDLDRSDQTAPPVLDLLGGATLAPRPVTHTEAQTLAQLRQHNRVAGGGELAVSVPDEEAPVAAAGWLDWSRQAAYLAMPDGDGDEPMLLWADRTGVAARTGEPADNGFPPLPVPAGEGWTWSPWEARGDEHGGFDLELLLHEMLSLSADVPDDPDRLAAQARWLRADTLAGSPVEVFEVPREFEAEVAPGEARMRYWVDGDGVLRRLEIRTRSGGFGQLDLTPGPLPAAMQS